MEEENEDITNGKEIKEEPENNNGFKKIEYVKKDNSKMKKIILCCTILFIFLIIFSTIFAILNIENNNIINGIYIENIQISNLESKEAAQVINEKIESISEIELKYGEYETIVKLEELGIEVTADNAIEKAIKYGKTGNIIKDNYAILKANLFKVRLKIDISLNDDKFNEMIKNIQNEIPGAVKEYSYEIIEKELIITNGTKGIKIDETTIKEEIIEQIKKQFNGVQQIIEIPIEEVEPSNIDIDKIYNEIHSEAQNAYLIEEPFEVYKEEDGIDFAITIDEAKNIIQEEKETYIIPLKITEAEIKVKDLGEKLFKQTLSNFTTIYDAGTTNRASNIELAAKTINGTIILPGETFSYNNVLGNTTKEKGYKLGGAYVSGKIVQTYGGGICQVSSTLYNAVLYANLEIVERHNHSYAVSYVPAGRDATVSYGGKDFKFKNTREYPIRIDAVAKNGIVSISISGIKEEKEYDIELTSTVLSTTEYKTVYETTSTLAEGKEKVIQTGHIGQVSVAYKIVKYNNQIISKTLLSKDTYKPMNRIIQKGTKKTNSNETQEKTEKDTTEEKTQENTIIE